MAASVYRREQTDVKEIARFRANHGRIDSTINAKSRRSRVILYGGARLRTNVG
jgi:hypothetical protein